MKMSCANTRFEKATDSISMLPFFQSALSEATGESVSISRVEIPRVFPRSEKTYIIQYRLILDNYASDQELRPLFWGILPGTSEAKKKISSSDPELFWYDDSLELLVPRFPYDPRLKYLTELWQSAEIPEALLDWLDSLGCSQQSTSGFTKELLGYRVERRSVLKLGLECRSKRKETREHLSCIAKIVRPKKAKNIYAAQKFLINNGFNKDSSDHLTVPSVYSYNSGTGLILMEYVEGKSLHDLIGSESLEVACSQAGEVLAKLHCLKIPDSHVYQSDDELDKLHTFVERTTDLFPDLSLQLNGAMRELKDLSSTGERNISPCCIHGDYFDKQILWSKDRTTLIDCDNISYGDPALDFGNFVAHMILRQAQSPEAQNTIERGIEGFTKAYKNYYEIDSFFEDRVIWWKSAALLRLACLYGLRPRWRHLSEGLLTQAVDSMGKTSRHVTGDV